MTQPAITAEQSSYYRHSGRYPASGLLQALLGSVGAGIVLGAAYAYVDLYIPIAGYITFLITGGTAFLLGLVLKKLLRNGKMRNVAMGMLVAFIAAAVMFVTSWEVWLYAFLQRVNVQVGFWELVLSPSAAWELILKINGVGAWSFNSATPTGAVLGLLWLVEAMALLLIPLWAARRAMVEFPFCEQCNAWCASREIIDLNAGDKKLLRSQLEAKDFGVLASLQKAPAGSMLYWRVFFQGCGGCDSTQTLCVDEIKLTRDRKGKLQRKITHLIRQLRLSPEETVAVATIAATLAAPPPSPPAEQNAS